MTLTQVTTGGVDENINIDSNTLKVDGTNNRVGINTAAPDYALHAVGTIAARDSGTNTDIRLIPGSQQGSYSINANTAQHIFVSGANERMRIDSSGNVGIGTASPSSALDVQGSGASIQVAASGQTNARVRIVGGNTSSSFLEFGDSDDSDVGEIVYDHSNNSMRFNTNASERMRIDSSGSVGIGVTAPAGKLTVGASSGNADVFIKRTDAAANDNRYGALLWRSNNNDNNGRIAVHRQSAENDGYMTFATANSGTLSERMRIDNSGRLLLGTTTEGYGGVADNLTINDSGNCGLTIRSGTTSAGAIYFSDATSGGGEYDGYIEYSQNSRFMRFGTAQAERMRIDSSGRVGIGVTSPAATLHISDLNHGIAAGYVGGTLPDVAGIYTSSSTSHGQAYGSLIVQSRADYAGYGITFRTSDAERMRINSAGYARFSSNTSDSAFYGTSGSYHCMHSATADAAVAIFENSSNSSPYGILIDFDDASPDNNGNYFIRCADSSQAQRMVVWSDGDIDNHDNSYSGLSDLKLKQDIVDAESQWDDIKDLRVRKFKFKSDVVAYGDEAKTLIGVVAQETELVSPGLVKESADKDREGNDLGTTTKSVRYSVLYMKAVKALQEAMDRIETLETKVAALEAAG